MYGAFVCKAGLLVTGETPEGENHEGCASGVAFRRKDGRLPAGDTPDGESRGLTCLEGTKAVRLVAVGKG